MTRHYAALARNYGIVALAAGVFYREFTKYHDFQGHTSLLALHTHYFALGMLLFLILALAEKLFGFSGEKLRQVLPYYQVGLNLAGLGFLLRGISQVTGTDGGIFNDPVISGVAGIGHILLGVCLVIILFELCKKAG